MSTKPSDLIKKFIMFMAKKLCHSYTSYIQTLSKKESLKKKQTSVCIAMLVK